MPPQPETPLPIGKGELIVGKYAVEWILGRGGMGFVLAARHKDLGHLVAIKMLLPELVGRRDIVERFLLEARAAVQLRSEHAVRVMDVGLHRSRGSATSAPEEIPFLVMEYLEGTSLGSRIRKGPLPIRDACLFVIQACDALVEAHRLGIVHRDLKPDNLFLTTRTNGAPLVKVLDFGISRVPSADDDRRLTGTTDVMGTPHYMAPEQMAAARNADARSDVWALGVTLYEMLTGRLPFGGTNVPEIITRVLTTSPPACKALRPEVPAELDALVMACLEKAPERRCPGAAHLAAALAPFAPGGSWVEVPATVHRTESEEATTLHRIAGSPVASDPPVSAGSQEWSAGTVPGAPLGSAALPLPTGALGSLTLDATTQIVRRKRKWGAIAVGSGALLIAALVLVGWWWRGAAQDREAETGSGNATIAVSAATNHAVPSVAAPTTDSPTSTATSPAGPAPGEPTTGSTAASGSTSPSSGPSGTTASGMRPVTGTGKAATTGSSGLKKTRK